MAAEEVEYESDPEEAKLSLKMRRRVASDDEDEGEGREKPQRRIDSDVESDGQGAAPADYDDEDEVEEEEEYLEEEEELEYEEEREYEEDALEDEHESEREGEGGGPGGSQEGERLEEGEEMKEGVGERLGSTEKSREGDGRGNDAADDKVGDVISNEQEMEEEKKENEPYAVPTAGAFYMHDDRFRDNAGARHRRTFGGRKLWELKDDRKWGHDKFEELTSQERQYEEGKRSSRGRFRGRGRSRGALRGYSQGNRPKSYGNNNKRNDNNDQTNAPKSVRGRGPRRYQPSFKNNSDAPPAQNEQFGKSVEKPSRTSSGRATVAISDLESSTAPAKKQVFASSLNSASPPFYPSSSSNKDITSTQKRDLQTGTVSRNVQPSIVDKSFPMAQSNTMMRGKNIVDSIGMDKLYIEDQTSGVAGKPSTSLQFAPSGSSSVNSSQSQHLRSQGKGSNTLPPTTYQPTTSGNLGNRVSPPSQVNAIQRNTLQSRAQPSMQASSQQLTKRPGSASQASSPAKAAVLMNSLESGELEFASESAKPKTASIGKGKANVQGSGRGLLLYGGAQVTGPSGNMNTGHGDQNFPTTPAFLPVMQLGGQHPGGIGVPAVGMAFPGYVGNPQLGLGTSEMTWLPVLAGAAGALGASYCSPYIALDGAYNARQSGQASALTAAASKENNANKPNNEWKSSQRPELPNDDFGQRQKNPRRYTEMKFDQ